MFGFFGRILGTLIAAVFSIAIWYIVDQKTAGAIAFLWLFIFLEMYFFLKFPRFVPVWLVVIVTQVLILGISITPNTSDSTLIHTQGMSFKCAKSESQPHLQLDSLTIRSMNLRRTDSLV